MRRAEGGGDEGENTHKHTHSNMHRHTKHVSPRKTHMRIMMPVRMHMNAIEGRGPVVQAQPGYLLKPRASFSQQLDELMISQCCHIPFRTSTYAQNRTLNKTNC